MATFLSLAAVIAAIAVGIPLSIWATAHMRRNRRNYAVASALLFSFGLINPTDRERMAEAREDPDYKRQRSGDPPLV